MEKILQLSSKSMTAGIILRDGTCVEAAPTCRWMIGKGEAWIRHHCKKHQINVQEVNASGEPVASAPPKRAPPTPQPAKQECNNCRFWSQMVARIQDDEVVALCLNSKSQFTQKYMKGALYCKEWKWNTHGAVDEPPDYGETANELYRQEEKEV